MGPATCRALSTMWVPSGRAKVPDMRRVALLLPLLALAACAPKPPQQAELCAIQALPSRPGIDAFDRSGGAPLPKIDLRSQMDGVAYAGALWPSAWWGRCAKKADTTDMILLGPEPWALTKGGPREAGQQRAYGTCYHRKVDGAWKTVACRINP